jgi:membrane fusion protein (multidrug efflux system)
MSFGKIATAIIVVLIGAIILYNKVLKPKEEGGFGKPGDGGNMPPMAVSAVVAAPETFSQSVKLGGTLLANDEVEIRPEISGRVTQMNISEGSEVQKGNLLLKINDDELQAKLKKLIAQKQTAEQTEKRLKELLKINGIGQQEYDVASVQLSSLNADIELTKAQIAKTNIYAPFSGKIGLRNVSIGAYVSPTTLITTLSQNNLLKLDFTLPERYLSGLAKGQDVSFTVDGYEQDFKAKIIAFDSRIDEQTRSIKVRAIVQNNSSKLVSGAFAQVSLSLGDINNAILIPTQCIIPEARSKKVILYKSGKAVFQKITASVRDSSRVLVLDGIKAGDTIISTGIMYVKPDAAVSITKIK